MSLVGYKKRQEQKVLSSDKYGASEMTYMYIVSSGALNSTHSPLHFAVYPNYNRQRVKLVKWVAFLDGHIARGMVIHDL